MSRFNRRRRSTLLWTALLCTILLAGAMPSPAQEAAQRLLLSAERSERDGNVSAALTDYEMVSRQFPGTSVAAQALMRIVELKQASGDVAGATGAANRLIDDFPGTNHAAAGLFFVGDMQLDRARTPSEIDAVRESFRRVWLLFDPVGYPDLIYRAAARVRYAELDRRAGDLNGAELSYLATLEGEPMSEWTMRSRLGLAGIYLERGTWMLAAETLQQAINEATSLGFEDVAADARTQLTLVHRMMLRPAAGAKRWQTARSIGGLSLKDPAGVAAWGDGQVVVTEELGRTRLLQGDSIVVTRSYDFAYRPFWSRDGKAWVPTGTVIWEIVDTDRMTYLGPSRAPVRAIFSGAEGVYQWFTIEMKPQRILAHRANSRVDRTVSASDPVDIATDGQGRLYILNETGGIKRLNAAADRSVNLVSSGLTKPIALDVDPMGNVYVLDRAGKVQVFDTAGKPLESFGPSLPGGGSLSTPIDLAVDSTGRLYLLGDKPGVLYVLE